MNKIILIGNLGDNPELHFTPDGKQVCNFSLAASSHSKDKDAKPLWFNIIAWEKLAELCNQHLSKGDKVYVDGRLNIRKYDDKQGLSRFSVEVIASTIEFLVTKLKPQSPNSNHDPQPDSLHQYLDEIGAKEVSSSTG